MKLVRQIALPMVLLASSLFAGAANAQTQTPPWGDIEVVQVLQFHDCEVYAPKADPDGGQVWTICAGSANTTPSSQLGK